MKEVSYNNVLGKDIGKSKIKGDFLSNAGLFFGVCSLLLVQILGVYKIIEFGGVISIPFFCGFYGVVASLAGIKTYINKKNKQAAMESLTKLENDLKAEGVKVSIANLQKAIVTEHKRELKETNRKGEVSNVEEIIKRYYMLDEQQQIQVLQQTLTQYRSETTNKDTMQLQLLEDEDLKNIELPETIITKRLQFNDTKK